MTTLWPVCWFGPRDRSDVFDAGGQRWLITSNLSVYCVRELERVAPALTGGPVFFEHATTGNAPGMVTRVIQANDRVGRVKTSVWDPSTTSIIGELAVTNGTWSDRLTEAKRAGELAQWGFSPVWDWTQELKNGDACLLTKCVRIFGVDLVAFPASGATFRL